MKLSWTTIVRLIVDLFWRRYLDWGKLKLKNKFTSKYFCLRQFLSAICLGYADVFFLIGKNSREDKLKSTSTKKNSHSEGKHETLHSHLIVSLFCCSDWTVLSMLSLKDERSKWREEQPPSYHLKAFEFSHNKISSEQESVFLADSKSFWRRDLLTKKTTGILYVLEKENLGLTTCTAFTTRVCVLFIEILEL